MRTLMISYLQNVHSDPCVSFLMVVYWHLTVLFHLWVQKYLILWWWANKLNNSWREKGKQFLFVLWITQKIHPVGIDLTSFCIHPSLSNYQECKYPTRQCTVAWTSYNKTLSAYSNESFGTSSWETVDNSSTIQYYAIILCWMWIIPAEIAQYISEDLILCLLTKMVEKSVYHGQRTLSNHHHGFP